METCLLLSLWNAAVLWFCWSSVVEMFCLHSFTWKKYPMEKFERLNIFVHMMKMKTVIFWSIKPRRRCKPLLSALLHLTIHHALLHMLRGPPKLQSHEHNPPYDVVSASPSRRACDLGRGDLYPCTAADQNSHGTNYMGLAADFGCGFTVFVTTYH